MDDKGLVERLDKYADWFYNAGKIEVRDAACDFLSELLGQAADRIESLAADAERYRYLKANFIVSMLNGTRQFMVWSNLKPDESLDGIIDTAIDQAKAQENKS